MTQPDEYFPPGAANYDSFAGFATTSQQDYEDQINASVTGSFGALSGVCALLEQLPFLGGLATLGDSGTNGLTGGMLGGVQSLADSLCGFATGSESTGTTPQTLLGGASDVNDAVNDNSMFSGILGLGQTGGSSGNLVIDMMAGILEFWGSLCGLATGSSDISTATPSSVLDTAGGFLDIGLGIFGSDATDMGGLFDWTDGWFSDLLGLLGNPWDLGSGSAGMLVPNTNLFGMLGPATLGGSLQGVVDSLFQGFSGSSDSGIGLARMGNTASALADQVNWLVEQAGGMPPNIEFFSASGTYDIPAASTSLDVLVVGGGGAGCGMGLFGFWGDGGDAGTWATATIVRDVDIPLTTTTLDITVGSGGAGHSGDDGDDGSASSASGTGWAGISGAGGAGATTNTVQITGEGAGNQTLNGVTYYGGAAQNAFFGADGNPPGGGGAGATVSLSAGGDGGDGGVWVRAYSELGS